MFNELVAEQKSGQISYDEFIESKESIDKIKKSHDDTLAMIDHALDNVKIM